MSKAHDQHSLNKSQTEMKRKNPFAIENHSAMKHLLFPVLHESLLRTYAVNTPAD